MKDGTSKKSRLSWSKSFVRRWFNIKSKAQDLRSDDFGRGGGEEWRGSITGTEAYSVKKSKIACSESSFSLRILPPCVTKKFSLMSSERLSRKNRDQTRRGKIDLDAAEVTETLHYRIFAATWNVGGKSPPSNLNLDDWLHTSPAADIYVLGFQEIVPLSAGNVLGTEDNAPAKKWIALIRKALNNLPGNSSSGSYRTPSPLPNPVMELDDDFEGASMRQRNLFHRRSFQSLSRSLRIDGDILAPQPRLDRRHSVCDRVIFANRPSDYDPNYRWGGSSDDENISGDYSPGTTAYCSPVSYGYRASSSIEDRERAGHSSHLSSGQKDGDELRRNSDVMEILRKTRFPPVHGFCDERSPETIPEHDRIIWLGDLNYRIALSYRSAKALVEMRNWKALLEKDQLRIEQRSGRVFQGWNEGKIYFPPTYKYSNNSDRYTGDDMNLKEKRRTPAWCDRILWYGRGLNQLSYVRGESRFSDHRPVSSIFTAEVESINHSRIQNMNCSSAQVDIEELLPFSSGTRMNSDVIRGMTINHKGIRDNSPEDRDRDKHRNREQCTGKNLMAELRVASTHHEITSHAAAVA
ncbi:type I inositol-1,4,5-trisphosphate 5-phosphatase [Musa troglodytarum]|uniref:Type I inositol-1,4,5-trisphosphate 5-phosphatase n=1 Tax=Musa troglodytarum TaxID=320322 RepID=A0A9E7KQ81_9LILI|nr:type I inositol-1,4,5-trisphosphate 5-phosphatase [Musa troglodytarum]